MIEPIFYNLSKSSDILHNVRTMLYQKIKVADDGELTLLSEPIDVIPHSNTELPYPITVTHAYKESDLLFLLSVDLPICANLVPIECMLPLSGDESIKESINAVKENIKTFVENLIQLKKENLYFDISNDSLECLRKDGSYLKANCSFFENDQLMISGTDSKGIVDTCSVDDIFVEDLCGLFIGHIGELEFNDNEHI